MKATMYEMSPIRKAKREMDQQIAQNGGFKL
jgi:hypothetical protein